MNARTMRMPVINVQDKLDITTKRVNGLKGYVIRRFFVVEGEPVVSSCPLDSSGNQGFVVCLEPSC